MKRILLILAVTLVVMNGFSQPQAGKLFAGGSFSVYNNSWKTKEGSSTTTNSKSFSYGFNPNAGYFLSSRIAVGMRLGLSGSMYKYPDAFVDKTTNLEFNIAPFGRYYLTQGNMGVFVQAEISAGFGANKTFSGDLNTVRNYNSFETHISPGIYYFVSPKVVIEAELGSIGGGISSHETGTDTRDVNSSFSFNLATGLSLGFKVILN